MGRLSSCYYIIESMLDLEGLRGWYCLRFFLDPLPLTLCWVVMGGRYLARWTVDVMYHPVRIVWYVVLGTSRSLRRLAYHLVVVSGLDDESIRKLYESKGGDRKWLNDYEDEEDPYTSIVLHDNPRTFGSDCNLITVLGWPAKEFKVEEEEVEGYDQKEERNLPLILVSKYVLEEKEERRAEEEERRAEEGGGKEEGGEKGGEERKTDTQEEEESAAGVEELVGYLDEGQEAAMFSLPEGTTTSVASLETTRNIKAAQEADGGFHREYMKLMRLYDIIVEQRIGIVSGILGIGPKDLLEDMEIHINSVADVLGKELSRVMQSDFEMVYVGHSCLNWEVLHHYYREVEAIASSAQAGVFHYDVIKNFQHFEVQLERFTEDERIAKKVGLGSKQFWNFINSRWSCPNPFCQVPEVSGYVEEVHDCNEESATARDVLTIIQKAIKAFSEFIEADKYKPSWKPKKLLPVDSPLIDPNDIFLLESLAEEVQKKEIGLKEVQKRKKHWWNKKRSRIPLDEAQGVDAMFSMIDIKLVSRVLKMTLISTQQLRWCQEKLNGIQLNDGSVRRTSTLRLFPYP